MEIEDRLEEFNKKALENLSNKFTKLYIKIGVGRIYKDLEYLKYYHKTF